MSPDRRTVMKRAAGLLPLVFAARAAEAAPSVERLRAPLRGRLILPRDADYEAARRGASFSPAEDRHPALIVRCADAGDVARTIEFARAAALPLAVKAG